MPLTFWAQIAFLADAVLDKIVVGIYLGVMAGWFLYNLFLPFSAREAIYPFFVILLASGIVEEASSDVQRRDPMDSPGRGATAADRHHRISLAEGLNRAKARQLFVRFGLSRPASRQSGEKRSQ